MFSITFFPGIIIMVCSFLKTYFVMSGHVCNRSLWSCEVKLKLLCMSRLMHCFAFGLKSPPTLHVHMLTTQSVTTWVKILVKNVFMGKGTAWWDHCTINVLAQFSLTWVYLMVNPCYNWQAIHAEHLEVVFS